MKNFYLLFIVQSYLLHISGQKEILGQSPKIKAFRVMIYKVQTVFHSGMFYKLLQYSTGKFFNIRERHQEI